MVALVDHKNVRNLHDTGLDALHIVSHPGHQNHHRDVGQADDIDLILAHADGLDHDEVAAGSVEDSGDIGGSARQAAEGTAGGHAANVNARVGEMLLHANPVTENRSPGVGTGGINGDNADAPVFLAVLTGQMVDQRTLARPRSAGESDDAGPAGMRE